MQPIVSITNLSKTYSTGHAALQEVSLDIAEGEILALLGPNGAGKTTLISIICGIVSPTSGGVVVDGHCIREGYRHTRSIIGLVPQELTLGAFDTVWNTVAFSRGLFGMPKNPAYLERLLKQLSLWDKKDDVLMHLSGGMKRRVLIAKALSHEPRVLFLDEPTAGVDVELRKDMWKIVEGLRADGVTIILTTHYIEEAEAIADRVGVINGGKLLLVEDKNTLMAKMGEKQLELELHEAVDELPAALAEYALVLSADSLRLTYRYDMRAERTGINRLLQSLGDTGIRIKDIETHQSSLEEIFVNLVKESA